MKKKKDNDSLGINEMFEMFGINALTDLLMGKPEVIKGMSGISRQKKVKRLVINLPEWLKILLKEKSRQTGLSMNDIVRLALTDYLAKEAKK